MRRFGVVLVLLGLVGLLFGGLTLSRPREVARVGSLSVNVQEDRRPLVSPWISGGVILAGLALVLISGRAADRRGSPSA